MAREFVDTVHIENFGCARDVTIELTPLHALIGPNDSGKSTILRAVGQTAELIRLGSEWTTKRGPDDLRSTAGTQVAMSWGAHGVAVLRESERWDLRGHGDGLPAQHVLDYPLRGNAVAPVRGATLIRWDPDALRRPCELIPEGEPLVVDGKGDGLAAVYDAILSRDREAFVRIETSVQQRFPTVKTIWLPTSTESKKTLGVTLGDGSKVHADVMSEGLLYWLAFAVLEYIDPTAILLIEEPENGLHPSRIADVMKVLRQVSSRMQVILATHSPLVINELQPEEVTILTRDAASGTRATRIDRTTHFQQRQSVYALGELWLSFADGLDESALVPDPAARPAPG